MAMTADQAIKAYPGAHTDQLMPTLEAPVVLFDTGLVADDWHDSDESVPTDLLTAGATTLAHLWENLGHHGTGYTTR
jgi:hypothetical protein